jgi:tRNA(fMet)-specific endonuclease VapC
MQYLLDTNICVFFLRGKYDLDKKLKSIGQENIYISEITIAELRFGAENSLNPIKSHNAVDFFISGISIIPIFGSLKLYAKEKVRLRKLGTPVNDEFDLLIGVSAIDNELILVTENTKDFKNLEGTIMENWIVR